MGLLRLIFTPLGFILLGLIAGGAGIVMAMEGREGKVPERTELTQVKGSVQKITQKWKEKYGSKRDIKYEIELAAAGGKSVIITIPENHLTEQQAQTLFGAPVTALIRGDDHSNVWELTAGRAVIIGYARSRDEHVKYLASQAENGPYVAAAGIVLALGGGLWFFRRRTKDEVA